MISPAELADFQKALRPLIGVQLQTLAVPKVVLSEFEPSQVGTIVGTLVDACLPHLDQLLPEHEGLDAVGLSKAPGILKDREGYPDFEHVSGVRAELKLLYLDPVGVKMKKPATRREPSARLTQKVTVKNVDPARDALLVLAYQLQPQPDDDERFSPTVVKVGVFSMIEAILARDHRLLSGGGIWFGDYETPAILSRAGAAKVARGASPDRTGYGRKQSEGYDYNEDTNFGKLKRIPLKELQVFLKDCGVAYMRAGDYPKPWRI